MARSTWSFFWLEIPPKNVWIKIWYRKRGFIHTMLFDPSSAGDILSRWQSSKLIANDKGRRGKAKNTIFLWLTQKQRERKLLVPQVRL